MRGAGRGRVDLLETRAGWSGGAAGPKSWHASWRRLSCFCPGEERCDPHRAACCSACWRGSATRLWRCFGMAWWGLAVTRSGAISRDPDRQHQVGMYLPRMTGPGAIRAGEQYFLHALDSSARPLFQAAPIFTWHRIGLCQPARPPVFVWPVHKALRELSYAARLTLSSTSPRLS